VEVSMSRFIGLDVHRDFCEVAISEGGPARSAGRVATRRDQLELFAASLAPSDRVVLEATGNALAIATILQPHVAEVALAHPKRLRAISHAKIKTDRFDARVLAELLAAGLVPVVWVPDERTRALRRLIARRRGLVKRRTQVKNEAQAVLHRNLVERPKIADLFGTKGRSWLATVRVADDEQLTLDGALRQLDFLDGELARLDGEIARRVVDDADVRRLMTIPGVNVTTAATLKAAIGDVRRFPTARHLVGYLGLHPTVRQSGNGQARHGRTSKEGSAAARHVLVEAAWSAARAPGPLRAFAQRVTARRGAPIAAVAVARKLTVLAWHLLTNGEDYALQRPAIVARKLRMLELTAGAPRRKPGPKSQTVWAPTAQHRAERRLSEQAELAYRRLVADWRASGPRVGAGATERASQRRPSKGKAARQATSS
jgi:transposase